MLQLSQDDDGRNLAVRIGQQLELRLPENPTAGYRWRVVEEGGPVCELMRTDFKAGTQPGEPGVHIRRYRVIAAGQATLKLVYDRAWPSAKGAARTFCLKVRSGGKTADS